MGRPARVALDLDAPCHVPWWPRPDATLFKILIHLLTATNRHAGHADILREQLDGAVGADAGSAALMDRGAAFWADRCARTEEAARAADPGHWSGRGRGAGVSDGSVHVSG